MLCVSGSAAALLLQSAEGRLQAAFTSATAKAYESAFRLFLAFTVFMAWDIHKVNVEFLLIYLEFLVFNAATPGQVANHLSALKAKFALHSLSTQIFDHQKVSYFVKSLKLNAPLTVTLHKIIDIPLLMNIVKQCDKFHMGQVFKAVYLLAFFSFLRISNLVPHSKALFCPLKQLTAEDIFFREKSALILVKWSKTLQFNNKVKLLHIPFLNNLLCPVSAIKNLLAITPASKNSPLFKIKHQSQWVPLTDNQIRQNLKAILKNLNLPTSYITFHSFRRSGATFAFNNHVPLQAIKNHGTWTSDTVWRYITDSTDAGSQVADTFASLLA